MKRNTGILVTGVLAASLLFGGCAGNDASNEFVEVGGYKEVEVPDVEEPEEITDEDVDNYIQAVLSQYATQENITDRAVETGDLVNIDFVGKMDGEAFAGGTSEGYDLEIGSGSFIDGFEDSVIGHMPGDTYDWNGSFPENYGSPDLAGKDVVFTITVNYINGEPVLPELTDELVQEISEESETVAEYREEVRKLLTENNTTDFDYELQESSWEAVLEKAEIKEYPEGAVEAEIEQLTESYKEVAEYYGMEFGEFLTQYYGMTEEEFQSQAEEAAKGTVKQRLVAQAIADKENLTPNEDELQEEYEKLAEEYGYESKDELIAAAGEDALKDIVLINRVKEFLAKNVIQVKD